MEFTCLVQELKIDFLAHLVYKPKSYTIMLCPSCVVLETMRLCPKYMHINTAFSSSDLYFLNGSHFAHFLSIYGLPSYTTQTEVGHCDLFPNEYNHFIIHVAITSVPITTYSEMTCEDLVLLSKLFYMLFILCAKIPNELRSLQTIFEAQNVSLVRMDFILAQLLHISFAFQTFSESEKYYVVSFMDTR